MNPFVLTALCLLFAYLSSRLLKHFATEVPVLLIGLPIVQTGLAAISVLSLGLGLGFDAQLSAGASLLASLATFFWSCKVSSRYMSEALQASLQKKQSK